MPGQIGISKAILDAEKRKRARREAKAPAAIARVKSELSVDKIDLSTNPAGGEDNSPNALEIASKKNKAKQVADSIKEGDVDKVAEEITSGAMRKIGGQKAFYRMQGFPRQLVGDQKNLPEFLKKEILDAPPLSRYNGKTMEMENLKPLNRAALGMTGRNGDSMGISRMHSHSSFPKQSAAGKAKLMKTKYGQTGRSIPNNQLIKPIFKKAKG